MSQDAHPPAGKNAVSTTRSIWELRAMLEAFAARLATQRIAAGACEESVLDAFEHLEKASNEKDYSNFNQADWQLHRTIVNLADVPGLLPAWESVVQVIPGCDANSTQTCWPDLMVLCEAHRDLVDAICDGDPGEAYELAQSHLDAGWLRLGERSGQAQQIGGDPLKLACAYLVFRLHRPVSLTTLAQDVGGVSPGHLARLFREQLGMSFRDYLCQIRMDKASRLLVRTTLTVNQVATRVGYHDPSRFAEHFRKHTGQTPSIYRRRFGKHARPRHRQ